MKQKINEILVEQTGYPEDKLSFVTTLVEDMEVDSLDLVEIVMALEDEFDIVISDDRAMKFVRVGDIYQCIEELVKSEKATDENTQCGRRWDDYMPYPIDLLGRDEGQHTSSTPLRSFLEDEDFISESINLPFACGRETDNQLNIQDLAHFPHLLMGGVAGSGKTSFLHAMLLSFFYRNSPADLKLILADAKGEFNEYHDIPHLAVPIITSAEKAIAALEWLCQEMIRRYTGMSEVKAIDIIGYNRALEEQGKAKCPRIVFVVDELWDLMHTNYHLTQELICRVAQLGRAAGIHLVLSSQHMITDVYTGQIKANIVSRIAFRTGSSLSSRIVLDCEDAVDLYGPGELILTYGYKKTFFRMFAPYVAASEIVSVTAFLRNRYGKDYNEAIEKKLCAILNDPVKITPRIFLLKSSLFEEAVHCVIENGSATVSLLQRKMHIGYTIAAKIMDILESKGVVGEFIRGGPRKVLMTLDQWNAKKKGPSGEDRKVRIPDYGE